MTITRHIPKLNDMAFDTLKKSQTDYLKTNGFFSTDIFSISSDAPSQIQAAAEIAERVSFAIFLQAVMDNDGETVKKCLAAEPELILGQPDKNLVIESKLTWQKFYAEAALTMAVKRKQIKMIELLLPYYDELEQTEDVIKAKAEALSAWVSYETQKNANYIDKIVIPREYANYAQSLIDALKEETFPHGKPGIGRIPMNVALSEKTELAFSSLINILLPKNAVKLDDYIDPELFLLALYNAYRDNFDLFQRLFRDYELSDIFCFRVIGFAQRVLTPETAKIFCEGLNNVEVGIREISARAESLKLFDGQDFYHASCESQSRQRFFHYIDTGGGRVPTRLHSRTSVAGTASMLGAWFFEGIMQNKNNKILKNYAAMAATAIPKLK